MGSKNVKINVDNEVNANANVSVDAGANATMPKGRARRMSLAEFHDSVKTPSPPPNRNKKTYAESMAGMEQSPEVTSMASSVSSASLKSATSGAMKREIRRQEGLAKEREMQEEGEFMLEHGMTKEEFRKKFDMSRRSVEKMWERWEKLPVSATPSAAEIDKRDSMIEEVQFEGLKLQEMEAAKGRKRKKNRKSKSMKVEAPTIRDAAPPSQETRKEEEAHRQEEEAQQPEEEVPEAEAMPEGGEEPKPKLDGEDLDFETLWGDPEEYVFIQLHPDQPNDGIWVTKTNATRISDLIYALSYVRVSRARDVWAYQFHAMMGDATKFDQQQWRLLSLKEEPHPLVRCNPDLVQPPDLDSWYIRPHTIRRLHHDLYLGRSLPEGIAKKEDYDDGWWTEEGVFDAFRKAAFDAFEPKKI